MKEMCKNKGNALKKGENEWLLNIYWYYLKSFQKQIAPKSLNFCGIILDSVHSSVL